jgi:hypothetical protein
MAIGVSTNGGGSLRYPPLTAPIPGANFKTPLAGKRGLWLGTFLKTSTGFNATGGNSTILGGNADSIDNGILTGLNGLCIAQRGSTATEPRKLITSASGSNTSVQRMWWDGSASQAIWAGMTALDNPEKYFFAIGACNIGWPGTDDFRVFRAIIPVDGDPADAQVEIGTPESTWLTQLSPWLNQIFLGAEGGGSVATRTSAGTAVEHVAIIDGAFPFSGGLPDTQILSDLAKGLKTYASSEVLNGGEILSWRPLRTLADTKGIGSHPSDGVDLTVRGTGIVTDGEVLGPGAWNPAGITINELPDGDVFEGVLGPAEVVFDGGKQAGQTLQYRILRENGVVQIDWTATGLSYPTTTSWLLGTTAPMRWDGLDYRLEVRDAAVPSNVVSAANKFGVGPVFVLHDQSTITIGADNGKPPVPGSFASVAPNNVRIARASNRTNVPAAQYQLARCNDVAAAGSGVMSIADEFGQLLGPNHPPVKIVEVSASGETIDEWIADELTDLSADPARWRLWSGYMTFMAAACDFRATALIKNNAVSGSTSLINTLAGMFDALFVNNPAQAQVWLIGPWRNMSLSPANTVSLRDQIATLDTGSSRYKVLCHIHDNALDGDGSNHQPAGQNGSTLDFAGNVTSFFNGAAAHLAGNIRAFRRIGRGAVARVQALLGLPVTVEAFGPKVVSARFVDIGKTQIDITFDRDIETPGGATTNLPQHWVTTDNWSTKAEIPGAIISARVVRLTKPSGNWIGASVRYDYCRDTPWQPTGTHVPGGEVNMLGYLDQLIYDTSSFEGGRGIVAQPILGTGIEVSDASSVGWSPAVVPVRVGSAAAGFAGPVQVAPAIVSLRVGTTIVGFTPAAPLPPTIMDVSLPPPRLLDGWGRRIKRRLFGGSD